MSTLYLDRNASSLTEIRGRLCVRFAENRQASFPLSRIRRIVMHGQIAFDSATLARLTSAGVHIVCLSGRAHRMVAQITGGPGPEARRRLAQYRAATDVRTATRIAIHLVRAKIAACLNESRRLCARRPSARTACLSLRRTLHQRL